VPNDAKQTYSWDTNPAVEALSQGDFEYVLTQELLNQYREAVDDPEALFPTIAGKHDGRPMSNVYESSGPAIATRMMIECFNAPTVGKKLKITGGVDGRYIWRGRWYIVTSASCTDEDGRLIERQTSIHMHSAEEVGRKWQ
jgi:hypothetical protein